MVQTSLTSWLSKPKANLDSIPIVTEEIPHIKEEHQTRPEDDLFAPRQANDDHHDQQESQQTLASIAFGLKRPLPKEVEIQPITKDNLQLFRRLITLLLPVPYSDKFYTETVSDEVASSVSRVAVWTEESASINNGTAHGKSKPKIVAAIRCRVLPSAPGITPPPNSNLSSQMDSRPTMYIATIATLAPYRSLGIAGSLLSKVTDESVTLYGIGSVTAHVWEANEEARQWYARLGFREVHFDGGYYTRIKPTGAWLLERKVDLMDGV